MSIPTETKTWKQSSLSVFSFWTELCDQNHDLKRFHPNPSLTSVFLVREQLLFQTEFEIVWMPGFTRSCLRKIKYNQANSTSWVNINAYKSELRTWITLVWLTPLHAPGDASATSLWLVPSLHSGITVTLVGPGVTVPVISMKTYQRQLACCPVEGACWQCSLWSAMLLRNVGSNLSREGANNGVCVVPAWCRSLVST